MDIWKEILCNAIWKGAIKIDLPKEEHLKYIIESECYQALCKIKDIINSDDLDDKSCFLKIEEIICYVESLGIDCGSRHDF